MKRNLLFAALVSAMVGLPAASSYALDPGCAPEVMDLLTNQADAVRARNRAYEREIINRPESTLYLTCFDQSLAYSARLGYIFSDNVSPNPPPANTVVFTAALDYPDWGAQHPLVIDLRNVLSKPLDNELANNFLPPWTPPNALSQLVTSINPILNAIKNFQTNEPASPTASPKDYVDLVKQIDDLVTSFPTIAWDDLPAAMDKYNQLITDLNNLITAIDNNRKAKLQPLLTQLQNAVKAVNLNTCTNIDDAWNDPHNIAPTSKFYPPEGKYYPLTPYLTLDEVLNAPTSPPAQATPEFVKELQNATDSQLLNNALGDLTGPLSQPGQSDIWPIAPRFPATALTTDIISQMCAQPPCQ